MPLSRRNLLCHYNPDIWIVSILFLNVENFVFNGCTAFCRYMRYRFIWVWVEDRSEVYVIMVIKHNIPAENSYRNLRAKRKSLAGNLEKLSSGYRINRAADDAAGLAISEQMRAKINGLNQAELNVDDGIGLIQTADGAMSEVHSMLERGVTLSTQAANGTYNSEARSAIQKELDELGREIDRIYDSTDFNGIKLLQGKRISSEEDVVEIIGGLPEGVKFDPKTDQLGYLANETKIDMTYEVSYKKNDGTDVSDTKKIAVALPTSVVDFSDYKEGATGAFNFTCCTCDRHFTANLVSGTGVSSEMSGEHYIYNIGVDGQTKDTIVDTIIAAMDGGRPMNHYSMLTKGENGKLQISDYRTIETEAQVRTLAGIPSDATDVEIDVVLGSRKEKLQTLSSYLVQSGTVTEGIARTTTLREYEGVPDVTLQIGPTDRETLLVQLPHISQESLLIDKVKVDTVPHASMSMEAYQHAINSLSLERARLGAYQNRLEHTRNYLGIASENTTAAESRIRDTDMAKEMADYTKHNILSQAAQSMLAQANQSAQGVLSLLQ
jgi:flagellin